jgi:hypothetical protein
MKRLGLSLLLLCVLLVNGVAASAQEAGTPDGTIAVQLLDAPVSRSDDSRARIYIVDHVAPGTTIQRRISVSNTTQATAAVAVYEGPAAVTDGAFTGQPAGTANELTSWTSLDADALSLSPGDVQPVMVTIAVPKDAAAGERYGVVWAEVRSAAPTGDGVTVVNRVGIRIYLSVGAGAEPVSSMVIESVTASRNAEGQPVITAHVRNTGSRAIDVGGQLSLGDGPGGLKAGPFPARVPATLTPGQRGESVLVLDVSLPAGPWNAHLELKSGRITAKADAVLTFPAETGTAAPVQLESDSGFFWWLIAVALVILLTAAFVLASRKRRGTTKNLAQSTLAEPVADGTETPR